MYNKVKKDTCFGDSGGPALVTNNGQRWLVGITSRGYSTDDCASGDGVYVDLSYYEPWIVSEISSIFYEPKEPEPKDPIRQM